MEEGVREARKEAVQPSECEVIGISNSVACRVRQGMQMSEGASLVRKPPSPRPSLSPYPAGRLWKVGEQMSIPPAVERTVLCQSGFSKKTEPVGFDRFILRIWSM